MVWDLRNILIEHHWVKSEIANYLDHLKMNIQAGA
jgi:hypothetical protein